MGSTSFKLLNMESSSFKIFNMRSSSLFKLFNTGSASFKLFNTLGQHIYFDILSVVVQLIQYGWGVSVVQSIRYGGYCSKKLFDMGVASLI